MRPISLPTAVPGRLLLAGAVVTGTILTASPARAEVTFDFATDTGAAGAVDLRQAFGWDAATLHQRAGGLAFTKGTLVQDVYSVVCGPDGTPGIRTVHDREFGTWFLTSAVDREGDQVRAVRITGARAAISGTTAPPMPDMPCPGATPEPATPATGGTPGTAGTIRAVTLVSTTTTTTLIATSGDETRELVELRTGPEIAG